MLKSGAGLPTLAMVTVFSVAVVVAADIVNNYLLVINLPFGKQSVRNKQNSYALCPDVVKFMFTYTLGKFPVV
jgi:hypothetical protein